MGALTSRQAWSPPKSRCSALRWCSAPELSHALAHREQDGICTALGSPVASGSRHLSPPETRSPRRWEALISGVRRAPKGCSLIWFEGFFFFCGGPLSELLRTQGQGVVATKKPPFTQSLPMGLRMADGTRESQVPVLMWPLASCVLLKGPRPLWPHMGTLWGLGSVAPSLDSWQKLVWLQDFSTQGVSCSLSVSPTFTNLHS